MLSVPFNHHPPFPSPSGAAINTRDYISTEVDAGLGMDTKVQAQDTDTHDSGSGSLYSDIGALENETDDFGQLLLQHARDTQRMMDTSRPIRQPYRKAKPYPKARFRFENDVQEDGPIAFGRQNNEHERTGSGGSNESEPPVFVPREWGRKAKKDSGWMRKIYEPSEADVPLDASEPLPSNELHEDGAIFPHRTAFTGDNSPTDWAGAGNQPVQSIETTSSPVTRRDGHVSTPPSLRHMNSTLQHILECNDQDFTGHSLIASTPALTSRQNRKIDELTRRELENTQRRAVTTRTIDQISTHSRNATLRRRSRDALRDIAAAETASVNTNGFPGAAPETRPVTASETRQRGLVRRRSLIGSNKENLQPHTASSAEGIAPLKAAETVGAVDRAIQAVAPRSPPLQRPGHQRSDSMNLLRKLARVSSSSPSPAKPPAEEEKPKLRKKSADEFGPLSTRSQNSNYISRTITSQAEMERRRVTTDVDAQRPLQHDYVPQEFPPEDVEEPDDRPDLDATPAPRKQFINLDLNLKTPVVTGAWVDTPGPKIDVRPLLLASDSVIVRAFGSPSGEAALQPPDPIDQAQFRPQKAQSQDRSREHEQEPAGSNEPHQPTSALAQYVLDARDTLGESTINSLEDIVNQNVDNTDDATITFELGGDTATQDSAFPAEDNVNDGRMFTQAEKDRRQESLAIEGLNKHLRHARTGIKDANRGLRRVERGVDGLPEGNAVPVVGAECNMCKGHGSVWNALWVEFRSLFYTWDLSSKYRIRFTWLGLACLLWWSWFLSETTLCSVFCQPTYAAYMIDYGVDPDAPEFPFVIPTLLFRPLRFIWQPVCNVLAWTLSTTFHLFSSNSQGYTATARHPTRSSTIARDFARSTGIALVSEAKSSWISRTTQQVVGSVIDVVDEAGSMWDDELI